MYFMIGEIFTIIFVALLLWNVLYGSYQMCSQYIDDQPIGLKGWYNWPLNEYRDNDGPDIIMYFVIRVLVLLVGILLCVFLWAIFVPVSVTMIVVNYKRAIRRLEKKVNG